MSEADRRRSYTSSGKMSDPPTLLDPDDATCSSRSGMATVALGNVRPGCPSSSIAVRSRSGTGP